MRSGLAVLGVLAALLVVPAPSAVAAAAEPDLREVRPGLQVRGPGVTLGSRLVFAGGTPAGGVEPWVSDGTAAGTVPLGDLIAGDQSSYPDHFVLFGGRVFFTAATPDRGFEWWSTDGTPAGTALFVDVFAGSSSANPDAPAVAGGWLYFSAVDGAVGRELYRTDGTVAGTRLVKDIVEGRAASGPAEITTMGDRVVFTAGVEGKRRPWISDGTEDGTRPLDDGTVDDGLAPTGFASLGDRAVFSWGDAQSGDELWVTDGRPGAARPLADLWPGPTGSRPEEPTPYAGRVVFAATTPQLGNELWVTDGSTAGTRVVGDLVPGPAGSHPERFTPLGSRLVFSANDDEHGYELWSTEGTAESTSLVADVDPGPRPGLEADFSIPLDAAPAGVAFIGTTSGYGAEPWVSNGTPGGTRRLADLAPGPGGSAPVFAGAVGSTLLFSASADATASLYALTAPPTPPPAPATASSTTADPRRHYSARQARRLRIDVPVRVSVTGVVPDGGIVTLSRQGRVVGSATLVRGKASVRITVRLRPGRRHVLVASWSGLEGVAGSRSAPFRVRVQRSGGR